MVFHMKTTLVIADSIFARFKEEAARSGRTISELVEAALRLMLERRYGRPARKRPLPSFDGGAGIRGRRQPRGALPGIWRSAERPWGLRGAWSFVEVLLEAAILMREHGVRRIYTRDADFHRFPFIEVLDPLSA
ncbi:MAG: hypothetical protein KatS3mg081_2411 [Gemmatimonadales bacterium]|nr:MAG: hypothetical protein KatS3mg081_2411 [Gemmatimonadales bacterium]